MDTIFVLVFHISPAGFALRMSYCSSEEEESMCFKLQVASESVTWQVAQSSQKSLQGWGAGWRRISVLRSK